MYHAQSSKRQNGGRRPRQEESFGLGESLGWSWSRGSRDLPEGQGLLVVFIIMEGGYYTE